MNRKEKRYKAHLPGDFYGVHVYGSSLQDARSQLRKSLGISRLPSGTQVYESPVGQEYGETRVPRDTYHFMD
jgi:hypothetical protein